jgi:hypothetical protein
VSEGSETNELAVLTKIIGWCSSKRDETGWSWLEKGRRLRSLRLERKGARLVGEYSGVTGKWAQIVWVQALAK